MRGDWKSWWGALLLGGAGCCGLSAAEGDEADAGSGPGEPRKESFVIEDVIHPVIAALPTPEFHEGIVSTPSAVTARNEAAQRHVQQGIALIQAAWDFEAYRHFCEAVRADPECLMAYWGIGLALAAPNNEFMMQRMRAVERMLDLMEAEAGTAREREYAFTLATLYSADASVAARNFGKLSERYPNDLQARLLSVYLQRDGYDEFGEVLDGQEAAVRGMRQLLEEHPENLAVMTFWAMLHAEAPDPGGLPRREVLPVVRRIAARLPGFPPAHHLHGHFEWRCGNHALAEEAFRRAVLLYEDYMEKNEVTFHGCDGWVRCQLYLATALHGRAAFREAFPVAKRLADLEVDVRRLDSHGANLVLWEGRTLAARLHAARGWEGDLDRAIKSLPGKDAPQLFRDRSLALYYLEGLRQYLGARRELERGNREMAREFREALSATGNRLLSLQAEAMTTSAVSEYLRALRTLEVLTAELRGLIALTGEVEGRRSAFNWFQSAVEKQLRPTLLMPPSIVYPMELRLADYYMRVAEPLKAAETYQKALVRQPNDLASLHGYRRALVTLGRESDAAKILRQIERVKGRR